MEDIDGIESLAEIQATTENTTTLSAAYVRRWLLSQLDASDEGPEIRLCTPDNSENNEVVVSEHPFTMEDKAGPPLSATKANKETEEISPTRSEDVSIRNKDNTLSPLSAKRVGTEEQTNQQTTPSSSGGPSGDPNRAVDLPASSSDEIRFLSAPLNDRISDLAGPFSHLISNRLSPLVQPQLVSLHCHKQAETQTLGLETGPCILAGATLFPEI